MTVALHAIDPNRDSALAGKEIIIDDYREAYWWVRDKTPDDARIMAWWDYGYQVRPSEKRWRAAGGRQLFAAVKFPGKSTALLSVVGEREVVLAKSCLPPVCDG